VKRLFLFVLVVCGLAWLLWFHETRWPVRSAQDPPQSLVVAQGAGVIDIGRQLQGLGLVRHPDIFRGLVVLRGDTGRLRAGEYALEGSMSLEQIVDKLVRGDVVRHVVTFPEGTNLEDMARLAAAKGIPAEAFLAAARNPEPIKDLDPEAKDLEGYLFPDTYDLPRGPTLYSIGEAPHGCPSVRGGGTWDSTSATGASGWPSPTRRRPWPPPSRP
jgi:UPF0755 protein